MSANCSPHNKLRANQSAQLTTHGYFCSVLTSFLGGVKLFRVGVRFVDLSDDGRLE